MSSLNANLLRGTTALIAQSKGLEITGRNLANVNTPGYTRQRIELNSGLTVKGPQGPESTGVEITAVTQARSIYLDRQVQTEKSLTAGMSAKQQIYSQVQTALGQTIDTSSGSTSVDDIAGVSKGISGSLNELFNDFQELASNPTNATVKNGIINTAGTLADKINTADKDLATIQSDLTDQINSDVNTVNGILKEIAGLNERIGKLEINTPGGALDLRDQRQLKIEELSKYMNIETRPTAGGNGQVDVFSRDGSGAEVALVSKNVTTGPVSFTGTAFTAGNPTTTIAPNSGTLVTQVQARDTFVQTVRDDLANFATQLRTAVNDAYNPGGTTGQDIFAAGTGGNLIQVASGLNTTTLKASASGDAGANDLANAVASIANKKFSVSGGDSIDGTLSSNFSTLVSRVGDSLKTAQTQYEDQQLTESMAVSLRDQVSGVSLDEETANLMNYQRAFQASARFITTIDQMLDTVVNQMGR